MEKRYAYHPSYGRKCKVRGSQNKKKSKTPISKITQVKRAGAVTQAI
jgi:hypothetical protein